MPRISKTEFLKLQKKLVTDAAIGEKFGITRQAVHQIRKLYEIPSSIADNPERNEKIIALYKKGMSGTAIAKKFDLSISQAYRIINDAGAGKNKPAKKAPAKAAKAAKPAAKAAKAAKPAAKAAKPAAKKKGRK